MGQEEIQPNVCQEGKLKPTSPGMGKVSGSKKTIRRAKVGGRRSLVNVGSCRANPHPDESDITGSQRESSAGVGQ